jgi:Flp pilus assembly protein TadG
MRRSLRSQEGAAYLEFIIAILPMLLTFWGLMQLNGIFLADIVVGHAATNAVRAAIVCDSLGEERPQTREELERPKGCAYEAAKITLSAIRSFGSPPVFQVKIEGGAETFGNEPVTAVVDATYHCRVPLVGNLLCGTIIPDGSGHSKRNGLIHVRREATLPNQGATYVEGAE